MNKKAATKEASQKGVFDCEIPDPGSFWSGEIDQRPTYTDYESIVFIKSKSMIKSYEEKWLGIRGSTVFFDDKKKAKHVKFLDLRKLFSKYYEETMKGNKKYKFKLILYHHQYIKEFYFKDPSTPKQWIRELRKYCILDDLTKVYDIGQLISQGAISKTFWIKTKDGQKEYMGKVYYLTEANSEESVMQAELERQMILNETMALLRIDHPNIIKLKEIHEFTDRVVILTEFISGGNLLKYIITRQSIPEQEAAFILKTILGCLKALHEKNIIHRNLKPENIFLNYQKTGTQLKLTDLAFSCTNNQLEKTSWYMMRNKCSKCGTPGYLAPELLANKAYDMGVDVFSMGVILYTCLTGKPLFKGSDIEEIIKGNYEVKFDKESKTWKNLSNNSRDLISRMIKKNPAKRISVDECLKHPFLTTNNVGNQLEIKTNVNILSLNTSDLKSSNNIPSHSKISGSKVSIDESQISMKSARKSSLEEAIKSLLVSPSYFQDTDLMIPEFYINRVENDHFQFDLIKLNSKNADLEQDDDEETPRFKDKGFQNPSPYIINNGEYTSDSDNSLAEDESYLSTKYQDISNKSVSEIKSPFARGYSESTLNMNGLNITSDYAQTMILDTIEHMPSLDPNKRECYKSKMSDFLE